MSNQFLSNRKTACHTFPRDLHMLVNFIFVRIREEYLTLPVCKNILLSVSDLLIQLSDQFMLHKLNMFIPPRSALKSSLGYMESGDMVRKHHVKRCRGAPLLHVSVDSCPVQVRPSEEESLQL